MPQQKAQTRKLPRTWGRNKTVRHVLRPENYESAAADYNIPYTREMKGREWTEYQRAASSGYTDSVGDRYVMEDNGRSKARKSKGRKRSRG